MNFNNKRIVITGAAGFIGSNLAHFFDENYPNAEILAFDIFSNDEKFSNGNKKSFGHFKNLKKFSKTIIQGDINNKNDLKKIEDFKPDIIFHEAAISDTTVQEQDFIMKTNLNAFRDLLDICEKLNAKMIYASSGATYGDAKSPQKVWEAENPNNAYGFSKLAMDLESLQRIKKGAKIIGLRYFNVYGKNEFFKQKTASMVLQFGLQILSGNAPRLFENSDKILRDFIYIKDVVKANICAARSENYGVYNVGTAKPRSFQEIADILQKELHTNLGNEYIKNPHKAYQYHTQAFMADTFEKLGFEADFSLEDGIKDYIDEIKRVYKEEVNV